MAPMVADIASLSDTHLPAMMEILVDTVYTNALTPEWLRYRSLDDPYCSAGLSLGAMVDGQLAGFAVTRLLRGDAEVKIFAVAEPFRRQGVATALFDELEARLRARVVSKVNVGSVGTNYFTPGVDLRSTDAISFLLHRGYQTDRNTRVDMAVDLTRAALDTSTEEQRLAAEGIVVRRATRDELPAVGELAAQHFSDGWRFEVMQTGRFEPVPLYVAWHGEEAVSFGAYDVTGLIRFGPTGTRPDYRRRGLGSVVLIKCLQALRDRGEPLCEISWAGPVGYYARAVGAQIHKAYWLFTKPL